MRSENREFQVNPRNSAKFTKIRKILKKSYQIQVGIACVAGVKGGGGRGGGREFGQKTEDQGGGKRTPAIKTPIGSFLRSLAAAKF